MWVKACRGHFLCSGAPINCGDVSWRKGQPAHRCSCAGPRVRASKRYNVTALPPHIARRFGSFDSASYLDRLAEYQNGTIVEPVSGRGSTVAAAAPLVAVLLPWLRNLGAASLVEASCGHWRSGWQASVPWPSIEYHGFDLIPELIADNRALIRERGGAAGFGLRSMSFDTAELTSDALPRADVLLTKDTLIHWPNEAIGRYLALHVLPCPPRFRRVLFVHDPLGAESAVNDDVELHHATDR